MNDIELAKKFWTGPEVKKLFLAELANEGPTDNDGVTPATVNSSIDSLLQAPDVFYPDPAEGFRAAIDLLGIITLVNGGDIEVGDLL